MKVLPGSCIPIFAAVLLAFGPISTAFANEAAQTNSERVLHTSGGVRHPAYDPTQNQRGCWQGIASVAGSFSGEQCRQLMRKLEEAHPKWRALGRRNTSSTQGVEVTRDGANVWVIEISGPPKDKPFVRGSENYMPYGKLHILAVNHRVYGRAGTILLDTLGDSPVL